MKAMYDMRRHHKTNALKSMQGEVGTIIGRHKDNTKHNKINKRVDPAILPQAGSKVWADKDYIYGPLNGAMKSNEDEKVIS